MEEAKKKLEQLLENMNKHKIKPNQLKIIQQKQNIIFRKKYYEKTLFWLFLLCSCVLLWNRSLLFRGKCILDMPSELTKAFRPPVDCSFCKNIYEVKYVKKLSPEEFEEKYAYNGGPVIVTDAMQNWTAPEVFDYWYFKDVYESARRKQKTLNCQFFPYQSGLKNLYEAFKMNEDRVNYEKGNKPWYFGWSNCNPDVAKVLREHYDRPYFLPKNSENTAIDWIFMGGHGMGAHMHIDNVRLPSWQAQLRGTKLWTLAPPPECYYECHFFEAIVHPGEIIALDTNRWYHQTKILSGDISITIGAEYD